MHVPILQALCLVVSMAPMAAPLQPLSLPEASRLGGDAPAVAARLAMAEAAALRIAPAGELPDPEALAAIQNLPISGADAFEFGRERMTVARVGLMQRVPNAAKREGRTALARSTHAARLAGVQAQRALARRAAAQAWIERWIAERRIEVLAQMSEAWNLIVRSADAAVHGGRTAADAATARAERARFENQRIDARARLRAAEAALERWVGTQAGRALAPAPDFDVLDVDALRRTVAEEAELSPLWRELEVAADRVALAGADKRPDWSVAASYGARGTEFSDVVSVEFRIDLPLFASRRQDPEIAARRHELEAARSEFEDRLRARRAGLEAAIAHWHGAHEALANLRDGVLPLQAQAADLALADYAGGTGALTDAVSARRDELDARLAVLEAQAELGRAWAALAFLHPDQALAGTVPVATHSEVTP